VLIALGDYSAAMEVLSPFEVKGGELLSMYNLCLALLVTQEFDRARAVLDNFLTLQDYPQSDYSVLLKISLGQDDHLELEEVNKIEDGPDLDIKVFIRGVRHVLSRYCSIEKVFSSECEFLDNQTEG
jgi:hypothetical protein